MAAQCLFVAFAPLNPPGASKQGMEAHRRHSTIGSQEEEEELEERVYL